jgi:hypothetical protein
MDPDLRAEYGWLQAHIWSRFEPVLTQVRATLLDDYPHLWTDMSADSGALYPFAGNLQIRRYIFGVVIERDLVMHFECSLALESPPARTLACGSYVGKSMAGRQDVLSEGPVSFIRLGSTSAVRHQVDQWVEATLVYIHSSTDLISKDLEDGNRSGQ